MILLSFFVSFENYEFLVSLIFRTKAQTWSHQFTLDSQFFIDGQKVQIRMASDLMDLEWKALLPEIPERTHLDSIVSEKRAKRGRESGKRAESFKQRIEAMLEAVIIPDAEYNKALAVMVSVRQVMSEFTGQGRTLHANMFRNCYLKLRNAVSDVLLIHIYVVEG